MLSYSSLYQFSNFKLHLSTLIVSDPLFFFFFLLVHFIFFSHILFKRQNQRSSYFHSTGQGHEKLDQAYFSPPLPTAWNNAYKTGLFELAQVLTAVKTGSRVTGWLGDRLSCVLDYAHGTLSPWLRYIRYLTCVLCCQKNTTKIKRNR